MCARGGTFKLTREACVKPSSTRRDQPPHLVERPGRVLGPAVARVHADAVSISTAGREGGARRDAEATRQRTTLERLCVHVRRELDPEQESARGARDAGAGGETLANLEGEAIEAAAEGAPEPA